MGYRDGCYTGLSPRQRMYIVPWLSPIREGLIRRYAAHPFGAPAKPASCGAFRALSNPVHSISRVQIQLTTNNRKGATRAPFLLLAEREGLLGLTASPLRGRRRCAPTFFRTCGAQVEPEGPHQSLPTLINKKAPDGAFLFIGGERGIDSPLRGSPLRGAGKAGVLRRVPRLVEPGPFNIEGSNPLTLGR
jgi:hypothetical protein